MLFVTRQLDEKEWIAIRDKCIATKWSDYDTHLTMAVCIPGCVPVKKQCTSSWLQLFANKIYLPKLLFH